MSSAQRASRPEATNKQSNANRVGEARTKMARALSLEGYAQDGLPVCPNCLKAQKGKAKIFDDGGFKCHACAWYVYNAVDFLTQPRVRRNGQLIGQAKEITDKSVTVRDRNGEFAIALDEVTLEGGKWPFAAAVDALLGADVQHPEGKAPTIDVIEFKPSFVATPNTDLYGRVIELGSVEAAQEFYARWFIDPASVEAYRAVRIMDQKQFMSDLREDFSPEEIVACGLATPEGYLLVNNRYPVVEPHVLPDGRIAGMQFRASEKTEQEIAAHKAYSARKKQAESEGKPFTEDKVPYVAKFLSLNGATAPQRCGFGLHLIEDAVRSGDPQRLKRATIAEGFKDSLAGATFGLLTYGLPGAGILPVRAVCNLLTHFEEVHVCLDADEAGEKGRRQLIAHLESFGIKAIDHPPPAGMDITDVLVSKHM